MPLFGFNIYLYSVWNWLMIHIDLTARKNLVSNVSFRVLCLCVVPHAPSRFSSWHYLYSYLDYIFNATTVAYVDGCIHLFVTTILVWDVFDLKPLPFSLMPRLILATNSGWKSMIQYDLFEMRIKLSIKSVHSYYWSAPKTTLIPRIEETCHFI